MQTFSLIRYGTGVMALAALAACSSTPPPVEEMAVGRTTLQRVQAMPNVAADAPVELQRARDKWVQAEKAMTDKDYDQARRLATEAAADARLAQAKADAASSAASLQQVQGSIRALQEEIDRRSAR
ncbi:MAG: DUF4398 domain-containing protein [Simplicispira sp.]|nr:DUF4398 domain-containing protein [Simplicispira sp.]